MFVHWKPNSWFDFESIATKTVCFTCKLHAHMPVSLNDRWYHKCLQYTSSFNDLEANCSPELGIGHQVEHGIYISNKLRVHSPIKQSWCLNLVSFIFWKLRQISHYCYTFAASKEMIASNKNFWRQRNFVCNYCLLKDVYTIMRNSFVF